MESDGGESNDVVLRVQLFSQSSQVQVLTYSTAMSCRQDSNNIGPVDRLRGVCRGATTFSKLGSPIPWSRLLYRTKYGWYTQFRGLQSAAVCYVTVITLFIKKFEWSVHFFFGGGVRTPPTDPQWLRTCKLKPLRLSKIGLSTIKRQHSKNLA